MTAPATAVPSLTLVRPRRGGTDSGEHDNPPMTAAEVTAEEVTADRPPTASADAAVVTESALRSPGAAADLAHGPRPLSDDDRTLLESMAPALATALVEVLVGVRATVSIEKWVDAALFERIVEHTRVRQSLSQGNPHADRPRSASAARICEVSDSAVEIALVVTTARRPRALAMRLTRRRARWKLTEFLSI